jgi:hypothetical protein
VHALGRLQGVAVAIRSGLRVLGSLSMRFTRSAMTEAEAGTRDGVPLNALARAMRSSSLTRDRHLSDETQGRMSSSATRSE